MVMNGGEPMYLTRSRVNSYGEWWEVKESTGEIIEELRSVEEDNWIRLTDSVTGDPLWLKAQGILSVASVESEYDESLEDVLDEARREPRVSPTVSAAGWRYDRRFH